MKTKNIKTYQNYNFFKNLNDYQKIKSFLLLFNTFTFFMIYLAVQYFLHNLRNIIQEDSLKLINDFEKLMVAIDKEIDNKSDNLNGLIQNANKTLDSIQSSWWLRKSGE